jgi:hypothetical protein
LIGCSGGPVPSPHTLSLSPWRLYSMKPGSKSSELPSYMEMRPSRHEGLLKTMAPMLKDRSPGSRSDNRVTRFYRVKWQHENLHFCVLSRRQSALETAKGGAGGCPAREDGTIWARHARLCGTLGGDLAASHDPTHGACVAVLSPQSRRGNDRGRTYGVHH